MADAVKWGIISTADINRKVIPGAHASPKVDLVGVASRDQAARRRSTRSEWDIPRAYGSYEELLADPEIEAVYISLPNTMHCEWSIKSRRGRQARALREAAVAAPERGRGSVRRGGAAPAACSARRSCTATTRRRSACSSWSTRARSASCALVRSVFSYSLYDEDNIRLRTDVEGGALMDVGCYNVSGSRLVRRRAGARLGEAWYGPSGTDWVFSGTLRFPGNVIGLFDCGTALPEQRRARGDRQRGLAVPRRPVALQRAGDRGATRGRRRADRDRARGLLPARARERQRRDPRRGASCCSAARTRSARRARSRRCTSRPTSGERVKL